MKIIAVSDIHGDSLERLEIEVLRPINPDLVLCLGDFDQTKTIREVMELQGKYHMVVVPGNHEYAIYHRLPIGSGAMRKQGKNFRQLYEELHADPVARAYVESLLNVHKQQIVLDEPRYGDTFRTIVLHGALSGNLESNPYAQGVEAELWYRLESKWDHAKNFDEMKRQGFRVMLRGHDGEQTYSYKDSQEDDVVICEGGRDYTLLPRRLHTITVGDYFEVGHYVVLDTNVLGEQYPIANLRRL